MIALFCGSRDWADPLPIIADLAFLPPDTIVVEGGCRGADALAAHWARERGLHVATLKALWDTFGKSAGPRRNVAALLLKPDVVYAYSLGGAGTRGMVNLARGAGVEVLVREPVWASDAQRGSDA